MRPSQSGRDVGRSVEFQLLLRELLLAFPARRMKAFAVSAPIRKE